MSRRWLPLAPPDAPGVWTYCANFVPTRHGTYRPGNRASVRVAAGPATPGATLRAWCALLPDDSAIRYIGTKTKIYVYDGTSTFTDRSIGGGYTSTATDWSFAQYGYITLATNRVDSLQFRDASTTNAFANVAGAPKCRILVSQAEQILAFDLNDGAEKPDAFAVSAPGDYTDWSGAGAVTATRIRHRPGKITAAIAFKNYVLAFKRSSVYKLTYTGGTYKWQVELIAIGRGAWGKHDVVHTGDEVVFSGPGGAWRFDGASFRSITDWFGEIPHTTGSPAVVGSLFSPLSQNAIFYSSASGNAVSYVYNLVSDRWGHWDLQNTLISASFVPMTGDPAALREVVGPTIAHPDLTWIVNLSSSDYAVAQTDTYFGASVDGSAVLRTPIEGIGGKTITRFGALLLDTKICLPEFSGQYDTTVPPSDTELTCGVYTGAIKDATNLRNVAAPTATVTRTSYSTQRRFDIDVSSVYARFYITLPGTSGYTEIDDYGLEMKPDGVQTS